MSNLENRFVNDLMQNTVEATGTVLNFIAEFMEIYDNKSKMIFGENNLDKFNKHVKNGGSLKNISFTKEDYELMKYCLTKEDVAFSVLGVKDTDEYICFFRDKDERKVELAIERFNIEKGIGITEVVPERFLEVNRNKNIGTIHDIENVELELIRHHFNELNIPFTTIKNLGKSEILYPEKFKDKVDLGLKRVVWDLTGKEGEKVKEEINLRIETKEKVMNILDDVKNNVKIEEDLYLVDSKNPNRFIQITPKGFVLHELTVKKEKELNTELGIVIDKDCIIDNKSNFINKDDKKFIEKFLSSVNSLSDDLVPLSQNEFKLINKVKKNGELVFVQPMESYNEIKKEFVEELKQKNEIFPKGYEAVPKYDEEVKFIKNLTKEQEFSLYKELKNTDAVFYIDNGELAWDERFDDIVAPIVDKVIYENKEELEKIREKLLKEGRGDINQSEELYIIDLNNSKKKPIKIHKEKIFVLDEEHKFNEINATNLGTILDPFKQPIILTVDEYEELNKLTPEDNKIYIEKRVHDISVSRTAEVLKNTKKAIKEALENDIHINYETGEIDIDKIKNNGRIVNDKHLGEALNNLKNFKNKIIYADTKYVDNTIKNEKINKKKKGRIHLER